MRSYTAMNKIGVVQEGVDLEDCIGVSRATEEAAPWHRRLQEPLDEDETWVSALCMGDAYDPECGNCKLARGDRRPHRMGAMSAKWAMSADLSGPHPAAIGTKFTYLMVAVVTTDEPGQNLPFVRGLSSKRADEVAEALESLIAELESITGTSNVVMQEENLHIRKFNQCSRGEEYFRRRLKGATRRRTALPNDTLE